MRRILVLLTALCLMFGLSLSVSAADQDRVATAMCTATVSSDGSCRINLTAKLHLENSKQELKVLLPREAAEITLNGNDLIRVAKEGQLQAVDLTSVVGNTAGDFTINLHYVLPDVVEKNKDGILQLSLPLLSGFDYSIEAMEFSVTLPDTITTEPSFFSGYHQADIEKDMLYDIKGANIFGKFNKPLKDHETLLLTMPVEESMFPQPIVEVQSTETAALGMLVCAGLALLFWIIFLRCLPARPVRCAQPPQGFNAGQTDCVLHLRGADLSLMVLTWAQLGYLLIFRDRSGRVVLYKQMDMGNERSDYEQWYFRKLFGRRNAVDTTGAVYTELCRKASKKPVGMRELMRNFGASLSFFRFFVSGVGLFGGLCIALELAGGSDWQTVLAIILALGGAVSAWVMQGWFWDLRRQRKGNLLTGGVLAVLWLVLGICAGRWDMAAAFVLGIPLGGMLMAAGGRRTELGKQTKEEILGLRHYLTTIPKEDVQRLCSQNPDYYHDLVPYAIALGAGKSFAKRFGNLQIPDCPYLVVEDAQFTTAMQWYEQLQDTVKRMNAGSRRLPLDTLRRITKQ